MNILLPETTATEATLDCFVDTSAHILLMENLVEKRVLAGNNIAIMHKGVTLLVNTSFGVSMQL